VERADRDRDPREAHDLTGARCELTVFPAASLPWSIADPSEAIDPPAMRVDLYWSSFVDDMRAERSPPR
jgi:hypothetical protein